jgi:3-hydroxyisobutyrate dehydrogenase
MHLAVLGTGLLGRPIAERLHRTGHSVTVYNRTRHKTTGLAELGVKVAASPRQALESADCILLLLADAEAIRAVLLDQPGPLLAGRIIVQMGTIGPAQSAAFQPVIAAAGGEYCEAPVLGSVSEARKGSLLILFGGTREQLTRCNEVLRPLGRERHYVGTVGKAAALKLALNQLIAAETAAFSLSLALVQQEHVDVELFMAVLRKSALFAPTFDKKLPRLLNRDYSSPNFSVRHLVKDLRLFLERARAMRLATNGLEGVIPLLSGAIDRGLADVDYSAMFETVSPQSAQDALNPR